MHSEKVPYYILDLLQQVPSVYVRGLGRFEAIFHPAAIDLQQSRIKPPYIQPDFISQNDSEDEILPAYMHYVSGMDIHEAKKAISTFANEIMLHIDGGETYSIEKFGTFSKSVSDVLHFTPDWDAFNLSFSGLEIIDLHPIRESRLSDNDVLPVSPVSDNIRPLAESSEPVHDDNVIAPDQMKSDELLPDIREETIPSILPEISESTSRLAWIILSSALLLITVLCAFLAWDIISDRKRVNQINQIYPDTLMITNEFDIPVVMDTVNTRVDTIPITHPVEEPKATEKPMVIEEAGPSCFVIVGAFTDQNNVAKMMHRLEGLGYKPAKIEGGKLTRVAISTSCDKTMLQNILNEARSGINPESWIY